MSPAVEVAIYMVISVAAFVALMVWFVNYVYNFYKNPRWKQPGWPTVKKTEYDPRKAVGLLALLGLYLAYKNKNKDKDKDKSDDERWW